MPMVKAKSENNTNNSGTMLTAADGTQYFVMGKIRIKVSEQFCREREAAEQPAGRCNPARRRCFL